METIFEILCLLLAFFIIIALLSEPIYNFFDYIITNARCFCRKIKIKKTPEYKENIRVRELSISDKLDNYNSKDIETILKFYKLDDKIKSAALDYDVKELEKYLRKKKIQKLI